MKAIQSWKGLFVLCLVFLNLNTKAQIAPEYYKPIFPNQAKFQTLCQELGSPLDSLDKILKRIESYYSVKSVEEYESNFSGKKKMIVLSDLAADGKNVRTVLVFDSLVLEDISIFYAKDDYIQLFGVDWEEEIDASKGFVDDTHLRPSSSSNENYHLFSSYSYIEINHHHNSKKEYYLNIIYKGKKPVKAKPENSKPPIKKGDIYSSVFPKSSQADFMWMAHQIGRQDPTHLLYDFMPYLTNISISETSLSGNYVANKNVFVEMNRANAESYWDTLTISVPRLPNDSTYFPLFSCKWDEACDFAEKSKAFQNISCSSDKHTFTFSSYQTFTHSKTKETESLKIYDKNKKKSSYKEQYYKTYKFPDVSYRSIEFKGRTNASGAPDGDILARFSLGGNSYTIVEGELKVKDGKLINNPDKPYRFWLRNDFAYEGMLDPNTWFPAGQGKYIYDYYSNYGENRQYIEYNATYTDHLDIDFTDPIIVRCFGSKYAFQGYLRLYDLVDFDLDKNLTFEGIAEYYPDNQKDHRYVGHHVLIHDGYAAYPYPHGEHRHEQLINGEWKIVEKTMYDIMDGSIQGKDFYGNRTKLDMDLMHEDFIFYPHQSIYDQTTQEQIADAIKNLLFGMIGPRSKVAKASIYLLNANIIGFLGKRNDESGWEPKYSIPGFKGIVADLTAFNKYTDSDDFMVVYYKQEPFINDQELLLNANKINQALYRGATGYFFTNFIILKHNRMLDPDPRNFSYDYNEILRFTFYREDSDLPLLLHRIYIKDKVVQHIIQIKSAN